MSAISLVRITGKIVNIDGDGQFFFLARQPKSLLEDDFAKIGLDGWEFAYADALENPAMSGGLIGVPEVLHEAFSLTKQNRCQIGIFALKSPADGT